MFLGLGEGDRYFDRIISNTNIGGVICNNWMFLYGFWKVFFFLDDYFH